jgi:PIN domain nuclease of toxin-antitoxin system
VPVLDSSALLAYLGDEPGADLVERELWGALIPVASWSETLQKAATWGLDAPAVGTRFVAAGVEIEPAWREDAELAATIWATNRSLALADRLCLATAIRLGVPALTADRSWLTADVEADVIAIR